MRRLLFWLALIPGIILWGNPSFARSWTKIPGGAPEANDSAIYGVEVLSDTDVWAVGSVAGHIPRRRLGCRLLHFSDCPLHSDALGRRNVVTGQWTGCQRGCALCDKGLRPRRYLGGRYRGLCR